MKATVHLIKGPHLVAASYEVKAVGVKDGIRVYDVKRMCPGQSKIAGFFDELGECGGIWKKRNKETSADRFTLSVHDFCFNANLGKAANQKDAALLAIILWDPLDAA